MRHLFALMIWGFALCIGITCIAVECGVPFLDAYQNSTICYLKEIIPDKESIASWIFLDQTPINGALWYLSAAIKCYGILWCYTRFLGQQKPNYQMLYLAGILLFVIYLLFGVMSTTAKNEFEPSMVMVRNAVLLGIPMFVLGIFLHQYWKRIWDNFQLTPRKLWILILVGFVLSLFEQVAVNISNAYVGSIIIVVALILLMVKYPVQIKCSAFNFIAKRCARWSVGVYLIHLTVAEFLTGCLVGLPILETSFFWWIRPLWVVLISLMLAILNSAVYDRIKRKLN